jgi:hypothetical protein
MPAWWESLSGLQRVFAYVAIPATVIMILQTVLVLFGLGDNDADTGDGLDTGDAHDGFDGQDDHDGHDGLALFSIRGIVAFFTIGGWAGVVTAGIVASPIISATAALFCGTAALIGIAVLFKLTARLQSAGNISLENAVGKKAKVYITIPGRGKGIGKIVLTFQERFMECDAVSDSPDALKTGTLVAVTGVADENTLIVNPIVENTEHMQ